MTPGQQVGRESAGRCCSVLRERHLGEALLVCNLSGSGSVGFMSPSSHRAAQHLHACLGAATGAGLHWASPLPRPPSPQRRPRAGSSASCCSPAPPATGSSAARRQWPVLAAVLQKLVRPAQSGTAVPAARHLPSSGDRRRVRPGCCLYPLHGAYMGIVSGGKWRAAASHSANSHVQSSF